MSFSKLKQRVQKKRIAFSAVFAAIVIIVGVIANLADLVNFVKDLIPSSAAEDTMAVRDICRSSPFLRTMSPKNVTVGQSETISPEIDGCEDRIELMVQAGKGDINHTRWYKMKGIARQYTLNARPIATQDWIRLDFRDDFLGERSSRIWYVNVNR